MAISIFNNEKHVMPYFENIDAVLTGANKYALKYPDAKAWDNKKIKTMRNHMPRGKVYFKHLQTELRGLLNPKFIEEMIKSGK